MQAALGVFIQRLSVLLKVGDQLGAMQRPLFGLAQAVDLEAPVGDADVFPERRGQQDQLGIDFGAAKAQGLRADLVKLAVTAALRTLTAKHRTHVVQALAAFVQQVVLGHRAHHAGGVFGTHRQMGMVAVLIGSVLE